MRTVQPVEKPNFDTVWAALQEIAANHKETDRQMKELRESHKELQEIQTKERQKRQEEFDRERQKQQERLEELDRITKNNAQLIGKLGGRFGEMIEYMVVPNLEEKFREFGYIFNKTHQQTNIRDYTNNIVTEVDITLENSEKVMIIEVKSKPSTEDIIAHIERMEKIRAYADLHNDKRIYLGAVAGMVFNNDEKAFAAKNGFYVIEPSGETFNIIPPQGKPKEW